MKAIIRNYTPPEEPKQPQLTRAQKRNLARQFHMSMKQIEKMFEDAIVNYHYDTFIEGSKVKLNYDRIMEDKENRSEMYLKFVEEHKDQELTIEYDPKYGETPNIFCLAEDDNEIKWTFSVDELELIEMAAVKDKDNNDDNKVNSENTTTPEEDTETENGEEIQTNEE